MDRATILENMDVRKALFGTFFAFSNKLQVAGDNFYEEMTCKQFFLLICLHLFEDSPPTISDLAEAMGTTHQNVKQLVNRLEDKGLVRVYQDNEDRRKQRVQSTERMSQLSDQYRETEIDFIEKFYEGVTEEEMYQILKFLNRLEANLERYFLT